MMAKKNEKKFNVYRVAGKVGKGVKNCGGFVFGVVGTLLITKRSDIIKKIKK